MADQCTATSKQTGQRCKRPPTPGHAVCKIHGSGSPQAKAKAAQRLAEQAARADVARFAARTDLHPAEALLDLVHYQAGVVAYWRSRVDQLEDQALEWGTTRVKEGGDDRGTTQEAKPHIAYALLREAQRDLAEYATAALKAGVDERRVALAERQGLLVATAVRRILDRLDLSDAQRVLVGTVVPEELRALGQGGAA